MSWLKTFWQQMLAPEPESRLANFTPMAQQVLTLAREEAQRLNHNFIGTEHLLLGLVKLGKGVAEKVLMSMGITPEEVGREVEKWVGKGPDEKVSGTIPYTPRVKLALALAAKEAKKLNHTYVGTEHILLGLIREGDGVAGRVLKDLNVDVEGTRQRILRELDPNYSLPPEDKAMSDKTKQSQREPIDITRRYDIYCREGDQEIIYRNTRFKGVKTLFKDREFDVFSDYMELELEDGQTIFINRGLIIKFCEHRGTQDPSSSSPVV